MLPVNELGDCAHKLKIQNGRNQQNARDKKLVDFLFIKMDMRAPCPFSLHTSVLSEAKKRRQVTSYCLASPSGGVLKKI